MMISYSDALNCFTDASTITTTENGRSVISSCAGYILMYRGKVIDRQEIVLHDTTNNFGEAYAVSMGIKALCNYDNPNIVKNLFSDSLITVQGLREWSTSWINLQTSDGTFISSSGKPVANQEVFKEIMWLIMRYNMQVQIFHILGHKNPNSVNDITLQSNNFYKMNGVRLDDEIVRELCIFNDMVDTNTRDTLISAKSHLKDFAKPTILDFRIDRSNFGAFYELTHPRR